MSAFPDMPQVVPVALRGDDVRVMSQMCRERARTAALPTVCMRYSRIADQLDEAARQAFEIEQNATAD